MLVAVGEEDVDGAEECLSVDGFGEVFIAPDVEASLSVVFHGVGGEGDDGDGASSCAEFGCGDVAVEDGHLHVHDDEVEVVVAFEEVEGVLAVGCEDGLVSGACEVVLDEFAVVFAVFDDEDACGGSGGAVVGRGVCVVEAEFACGFFASCVVECGDEGEREGEGGALARFGAGGEGASHLVRE